MTKKNIKRRRVTILNKDYRCHYLSLNHSDYDAFTNFFQKKVYTKCFLLQLNPY